MSALLIGLFNVLLQNLPALIGVFGLAMKQKHDEDKKNAEKAAFELAVDVATFVAKETLGNKEKRDKAVQLVTDALPPNIKKFVPDELVSILVEKAYQQVVKPKVDNSTSTLVGHETEGSDIVR